MNSIVFLTILVIVSSILAPDNTYRSAIPRRRYSRWLQMFVDDDSYDEPIIRTSNNVRVGDRFRAFFRRRRALKHANDFLTKSGYVFTLKNNNVLVIFDKKNKTLTCLNNKQKTRSITVSWAEQYDKNYKNPDNLFEETFDNICFAFDRNSSYKGIVKLFKKTFDVIHESEAEQETVKSPFVEPKIDYNSEETIKFKPLSENMLDINSASEDDLAKLPGITVILAKRIIQSRDLRGGFKSVPEMYNEFKIKPHFQRQLDRLICVKEKEKVISDDDFPPDRIVDF